MIEENESVPAGEAERGPQTGKVRRSIFIPQELEDSLARLAEERGTTTNDLIGELLARAVASLEDGSSE